MEVLHLNEVNLQVHCAESAPVLFYLTCVWHSDHMFPVTLTLSIESTMMTNEIKCKTRFFGNFHFLSLIIMLRNARLINFYQD